MPGLPQPKQLETMIETAMLDRAPQMHRQLKMAGELPKVLTQRAQMARDSYETAMSLALTENSKASRNLTFLEGTAELYQARSAAAETAIAQAVEFDPSPPATEPTTPQPAAL